MKGLKKKFALVLAFVAVFAMCGSALAAGEFTIDGKGSYDILWLTLSQMLVITTRFK